MTGNPIEQYLAALRPPAHRTAAGVAASVLVALGYAAAMATTLARQRRDARTTELQARYAR